MNNQTRDTGDERKAAMQTIEDLIQEEMIPHIVDLWGQQTENYTPALLDRTYGDGNALLYFTPMDTRPNYYIARVDTGLSQSDEALYSFIMDELISALETQFGRYDDLAYGEMDESDVMGEVWTGEEGSRWVGFPAVGDLGVGFYWSITIAGR